MRLSITCLSLIFLLGFGNLLAQTTKDATVPIAAAVNLFPASITLTWSNPSAANLLILRRTKGQGGTQWIQILNQANSTLTTYTDNAVSLGQTYEYVIQRVTTINAFGYCHVAVRAPLVDSRGKVLIFVDSTTADALGVELVRMKNDMRGDGWVAIPFKVGPSATPASVKAQIVEAYATDPQQVRAVLLIGDVPVPYSGAIGWDAHADHFGAWPADSYYADVNGTWTDETVNNDTSGRQANRNIPGDGKFDQSAIPTAVELQVGRIDFSKIDAPAFGEANAIGLVRRYLDKNHAWRTGAYTVENKALVDDNFGYFGGEAFAANGFRNAYPLVGEANIVEADFFNNTNPQKWLLGYGCGGGGYQGAGGVGSSANFATDTVNIVFSNLFGSYFGDWDFESNPFMPAALASRGGILTCSWAGRPHWFNQALASGETIGYCHRETQNAQFNNGFFGSYGESGAHTALLGDPTLRAHIVTPPSNVTAANACDGVAISWTASTEAVDGYHVYRSLSNDGPYARISSNVVSGVSFVDNNPVNDTLFYQVRAIKSQVTPGGGIYVNNSVGPISYVVYVPSTPPTISVQGGTLTCVDPFIGLAVSSSNSIAQWAWSGPLGASSSDTIYNVTVPGTYNVVITDVNGCTASSSAFVAQNTIPPVLSIVSASGVLTCQDSTTVLSVSTSTPLDNNSYQWSNGATTATITVDQPMMYQVTVNSQENGCPGSVSFNLTENIVPPNVNFPDLVTYTCNNNCILLALPNPNNISYYVDLKLITPGDPATFCNEGSYNILAVSNSNGCSTEHQIQVEADVNEPGAFIGSTGTLTCQTTSVQLLGNTSASDVTYLWSGPGINANNQNQQNPTVSAAGTYTLLVSSNENGCTSTDSFAVAADGSVPVISVTGGSITCSNANVILTCSSSIPNSTFNWTGPNSFSSTDQNPLTTFPGSYTVVVTTPSNCSATGALEVLDQTQIPEFIVPSIPNLTCATPCVTVQIIPLTSGLVIPPVTYCDGGTYQVTITSANGCSAVATLVVTEDQPFSAAIEPAFIDCEGSITLTALGSGGTEPYSYLWSNGSTFSSALFILNGTPISVTVTDANGCIWESDPLTITAPPPINLTSTIVNENGTGALNGSINLTVTGGTPPFGFSWSNGATTEDLANIGGGTYTVVVTELTTGCTTEFSFMVQTTVGATEAAFLQELSISPNPTAGVSLLTLKLDQSMSVKVEVRDVLGRLILDHPVLVTRDLSLPIDLSHQAAGVYNVSIVVDNQVFVRKLVRAN